MNRDHIAEQPESEVVEHSHNTGGIRTTVDKVVAAGQLLAAPRKCKIWHECWLRDGLTVQHVASVTSIPQSTAYDLSREMLEEGTLYRSGTSSTGATIVKPTEMELFVSSHPEGIGPQFNVHSTLIGVVGLGVNSPNVETFLERNNFTRLSEAITAVLAILSGNQDQANDLANLLEGVSEADCRLIEGHIAAVLQREAKKSDIQWEFPDDPSIEPRPILPSED